MKMSRPFEVIPTRSARRTRSAQSVRQPLTICSIVNSAISAPQSGIEM